MFRFQRKKKTITDVLATSEPKPGGAADLQDLITRYYSDKRSVIELEELKLQSESQPFPFHRSSSVDICWPTESLRSPRVIPQTPAFYRVMTWHTHSPLIWNKVSQVLIFDEFPFFLFVVRCLQPDSCLTSIAFFVFLFSVCPKWAKIQKQHSEKSSVVILIVCSSALRTIELLK